MRRKVLITAIMLMAAVAVSAVIAFSPSSPAKQSCKSPCPVPPEGCVFLGCDGSGNCMYDCSGGPLQQAAPAGAAPRAADPEPSTAQASTAQSSNPCDSLPKVCRYTYDPRENCCIADPRLDCYDICF